MASRKLVSPQVGTVGAADGESHTGASASVCPTVSEGGTNCHLILNNDLSDSKRTNDDFSDLDGTEDTGRTKNDQGEKRTDASDSDKVKRKRGHARDSSGRFKRPDPPKRVSASEDLGDSSDSSALCTKPSPRGHKRSRSLRATRRRISTLSGDSGESLEPEPEPQRSRKADFMKEGCEDEELERLVLRAREARAYTLRVAGADAPGEKTACALRAEVVRNLDVVQNVALRSRSLKGTFVRSLKDAASAIKEAVVALSTRSVDEEVERLQADNNRLQTELSELRRDLAKLREELRATPRSAAPPRKEAQKKVAMEETPSETLMRAIMVQVGTMVNARVGALEDRLPPEPRLRPSLAADKRQSYAAATAAPAPTPAPQRERPGPKSKKGPASKPAPVAAPAVIKEAAQKAARTTPAPATSQPKDGEWQIVGANKKAKNKKKKAAKKKRAAEAKAAESARRQKASLRAPRSSAVVLTLRPGAEERGATYAKVLAEAKSRVNLQELGIEGLRFRAAATGARILEIPGATSGDKADSLAAKLRESLAAEDVAVSRPTKNAELRVVGLDDSTSAADVVAALAAAGGCSSGAIRPGELRRDRSGLGSLWCSCPVSAAKRVVERGRILVGWVSAQVKLLEPRPMRCYRCLLPGHVGARCPSSTDRSGLCYRCGKPGHLAAQCGESKPHCAVCSAAGKPAEHRLGGKGCTPPKRKPLKAATNSGPSERPRAENMDTAQ